MKINLNMGSLVGRLRQNIGLVLGAALFVLLLLEGLVVQQSVSILLSAHHVEPVPQAVLVRVNFGLYNTITKRFDQASAFTPTPVTAKNPFAPVVLKVP